MTQRNVLGQPLEACCLDPITGFHRDGFCRVSRADVGVHAVCAVMTQEFLDYTAERGNDLVTPRPEYGFPGLKAGDRWCLCAGRWAEAADQGKAPPVVLAATDETALEMIDLALLKRHALQ